jgi:superfamily II DNA or RNA helicase
MAAEVIPVTGRVTFTARTPPRDSAVEFADDRRTFSLPMRAALPILGKAQRRDDLAPQTRLLAGSVQLGLRLLAAGHCEPGPDATWRVADLPAEEEDRVVQLAESAQRQGLDVTQAEALVRQVLDAVADTLAPKPPAAKVSREQPRTTDFSGPLQQRLARYKRPAADDATRPHLVALSLRIEADEEELLGGCVRLIPQVHDEHNALHLADAADLWLDPGGTHGFGERARTHATLALRNAADAWAPLERLLEMRVPDQITLDTDELVSLLDEGVGALEARRVDVLWPRTLGRDLTAKATLDARGRPDQHESPLNKPMFGADELFAFRWQLAVRGDPLTEDEMDHLANAASPVVKLRGNWMTVPPAIAKLAKRRLIRTARPAEAIAAALTGVVEIADETEEVVVGASLLKVRDRLRDISKAEPIEVPADLNATLRDYQRHGLTWLAQLTSLGLGACLADDMGLGKTLQLIALHLHRHREPGAGPTLVVCPTSLLGNWEREVARFAPTLAVRRFHGSRRDLTGLDATETTLFKASASTIVLTTYGTLRADLAAEGALAKVEWDLVVADEAQHLKNPRSATARAIRKLKSNTRVALTGTPVENNLTDLWAILDWSIPGLLGSRLAFRKVWAGPIESGDEPTKARQFADLIEPFILRRRKTDPGIAPELPAKTETDHPLALTREQVVLYEAFTRDCLERIQRSEPEARRGLVLAMLTGLKQICNHPAQFLKQANPRLSGRSEKFEALDELVPTVVSEGGGVLLFTQYVELGRLLERQLSGLGLEHQFLHGGTSVAQREAMVERFQTAAVPPVFILSLKAGGTGLNLTRADHVIHVDRWWNPAVEEQATDRAYRIGQTRPVFVHRLITKGTIEERIAELLTRKRGLADAVLGAGEAALTELSDAELRDLVDYRPDDT